MSSADDRWEILQLLHLYAHAVDTGDFETFGGLFAKGTFRIPGHTMRGAHEVKRHARESVLLYDGSPRTNHFVQNPLIEIDPDQRTAGRSAVLIARAAASFTVRRRRSPPASLPVPESPASSDR
jgi:hypothetical protein